jgi:pre-mRNA-processing factor 17
MQVSSGAVPHSERHGKSIADYQGRTFTDERRWPPKISYHLGEDDDDLEEVQQDEQVARFLGKRAKTSSHKPEKESRLPARTGPPPERDYIGHSMGINKVRLYGCLALTTGMDGSVMIWDTSLPDDVSGATMAGLADERGAIQTYWGHDGRAVKDCTIPTSNANTFVSCGYDGYACLWDTETGQIIQRFRTKEPRVPVNAARFKPGDDNQLLIAFGDRRLRHWDLREASKSDNGNKPSQTYDFHQSSVSSVNFCEHGQKFISTGEDRKLLVWDWGVPSPVKIISEIWLPSMPTTAIHPNTMSFVAVGQDNKIFQFRVHSQTGVIRKSGECLPDGFKVAGFSCEPAYSACGKHIACGDGTGSIHFIKPRAAFSNASLGTTSTHRIVGAHTMNTSVSCVQFHPCFDGVLISVGWDGKMRWWN